MGNLYSEDLVETLQQYHRSGRSLLDLDKTIYDFCEETSFSVSVIWLNSVDRSTFFFGGPYATPAETSIKTSLPNT